MTIHFTSDTHLSHGNIIWYCKRPFADAALLNAKADLDKAQKTNASNLRVIKSGYLSLLAKAVDRMDEKMIANWNDKVKPGDTVYHLGDVLFCEADKAARMLDRLHGQKFLIFGNHDKTIKQSAELRSRFVKCCDYYELKVGDQMMVMSHYAMLVWNKSHRGSWMLHGHSHGGLKYPIEGKILDVGADPHGLTPISYDEVEKIMATKKTQPVDHHV
jgi:calcineurin-like phosphoesterase family protein